MSAISRPVSRLAGYAPSLPTPFDGNDAVDGDALAQCCSYQIRDGATALVVCGATGEAPTLTFHEHEQVIRIADCHLHHYGKAFKAGRKVGHATLRCQDAATLQARIAEVQALIARG